MKVKSSSIQWRVLFLCVLGTLTVGTISGLANTDSITTWYAGLIKPSFNPPNWIFGPVWTLLYILMGIGIYQVIVSPAAVHRTRAIRIYVIQLLLNFTWSFLFFYFRSPAWAFLNIILLWFLIWMMVFTFRNVRPLAAWLQLPYLAWVSFATLLNASIWYLNG